MPETITKQIANAIKGWLKEEHNLDARLFTNYHNPTIRVQVRNSDEEIVNRLKFQNAELIVWDAYKRQLATLDLNDPQLFDQIERCIKQ